MVSALMSRTGGAAAATLASTALPISIMPRNWPCASSAAAPENPAIGTGWRNSIAVPSASRALISVSLRLPSCSFGSGMPTSVSSCDLPLSARRAPATAAKSCAPVDAQQRQPVVRIVGDAVGVAEAGGDDHLAALRELRSVTMWPCALTTSPLPYSTDFASAA